MVSDGSRHGSPERWRSGGRYKPRTQAISPPGGDSRHSSPQSTERDHLEERGRKRTFRTLEQSSEGAAVTPAAPSSDFSSRGEARRGSRLIPTDPREAVVLPPASDSVLDKKSTFRNLGVDSGLSEDMGSSGSCGSSGTVPDVDNAKLPRAALAPRRTSTDSAVSRSSHVEDERLREPLEPVYNSTLLRVVGETERRGSFAPRTPTSPPPDSDSESRPGTPLCDENPENLMSETSLQAAPVRLANLRTSASAEPMSLPLPR